MTGFRHWAPGFLMTLVALALAARAEDYVDGGGFRLERGEGYVPRRAVLMFEEKVEALLEGAGDSKWLWTLTPSDQPPGAGFLSRVSKSWETGAITRDGLCWKLHSGVLKTPVRFATVRHLETDFVLFPKSAPDGVTDKAMGHEIGKALKCIKVRPREMLGTRAGDGKIARFVVSDTDQKHVFVDVVGVPVFTLSDVQVGRGFSEGLAPVRKGGKWGYIDATGHLVVPFVFLDAHEFSEGLAAVALKRARLRFGDIAPRYTEGGFIDKSGKTVIRLDPTLMFKRTAFHEGFAVVPAKYNKQALIDREGKKLNKRDYHSCTRFSEGLAAVQIARNQYQYIDRTGKVVLAGPYALAAPFSSGLAKIVTPSGDGAFIDKTGKVALTANPKHSRHFREGLLIAKDEEVKHYGFKDKQDKWAIPARWAYVQDFSDGLAAVRPDFKVREWGYIDRQGKQVIEVLYRSAGPFVSGLARVSTQDHDLLIRKDGTVAWKSKPRPKKRAR